MGKIYYAIILFVLFIIGCNKEEKRLSFVAISEMDTPEQIIQKAAHVVPTKRQLEWQELEYTGFVHFGINTFEPRRNDDPEKGKVHPDAFNPTELDCRQWCKVFKEAGMKGIIFTAKHHDGFCLWPTKFTDYSVCSSTWKNGKGDVVKEMSEACHEFGLKLGVYLSPWDKHSQLYGTEEYNTFFKNQLRELLTNYGDIFEVWFDGACFEGTNGKKQVYDWQGYFSLIRELQPNAVIAIMGPDVRWVGTESGYGRDTEWSIVPATQQNLKEIANSSQKEVGTGGAFIPSINRRQNDIGSHEKILNAKALIWYPSEVDVSIRPKWWYFPEEDLQVKTPQKLMDIYYSSVGKNSLLLLNVPPDKRGLLNDADIKSLMAFKKIREETFRVNYLTGSKIKTSDSRKGFDPKVMFMNDSYWTTTSGSNNASIEFELNGNTAFDRFMIQENIRNGQRVEEFSLEIWQNNKWSELSKGTTIGYKRILRFPLTTTSKVRLKIIKSRDCPEIKFVGLFKSPNGI